MNTTPCAVTTLSLIHFRNHAHTRLEPGAESVILTGHNGAGKTNILEAVSLLAPGRGLRRARLCDIDSKSASGQPWAVSAHIRNAHGDVQIGTGRDPASQDGDKRIVRIDGTPARSHTALAEHISIAWLTPREDGLFMEGGTARRKFLDRLVYGFDPTHATRVNAYEYAMRERNRLLADARGADTHWLTSLERKMAETGAAIAHARLEAINHINHVMQASPLSFPKAALSIAGFTEDALARGDVALQAEDALAEALERNRREDAGAGRTLIGVHRSALTVLHLGRNMEAEFCSTGEQKALLLALTLAEARASARWHHRVPVLLLDEVAAHLDKAKRRELFDELSDIGAQAWMTGTDEALFDGIDARRWRVEAGTLATQ